MNWETIFTAQRIGYTPSAEGPRSGFQRDFDKLIFSSAFRRLQNKTQVFPLPGSTFVHNRLTHSLEVASVGRSLGSIVGRQICELVEKDSDSYEFYKYELANVVAAGCLAHDIGNPAFGHSGEKAISAYFIDNAETLIDGKQLQHYFEEKEWADLINFEGNANAVRILTHTFKGRLQSGLGLTYTTIASILKYPCEATAINKQFKHRKKYGFFQSEKEVIKEIAEKLGMPKDEEDGIISYRRHPFVYLVEAADDICYRIIDMEDAHRLGILPHEQVLSSFLHVIDSISSDPNEKIKSAKTCDKIGDLNEKIAYLRAKAINLLTIAAADIFLQHKSSILNGTFNDTLLDVIDTNTGAFEELMRLSNDKIYNNETVLEIEIAGYSVMSELLELVVPPLLKVNPDHKDKKILKLFPMQYTEFEDTEDPYKKVMNAVDLISGMTDLYATELYRKLKGFEIPSHR